MDTRAMVNIALKLAGLEEDTVDTEIGCAGQDVKRVLAGIDMDTATLLAAKQRGYDCVAEHHGIMGRAVRIGADAQGPDDADVPLRRAHQCGPEGH